MATGSWLLEVETGGPHWLGPTWFRARGLDLAQAPEQIQLFLAERPIPYVLLEGPQGLGLLFYADPVPSRYASWSAYRLEVGRGAGQVMAAAPTPEASQAGPSAASATAQSTFWATRWLEQDLRYLPQIEAATPWFWELVPPGGRISQTVTLTEAAADPVTVTVRLLSEGAVSGQTPAPRLVWNGQPLGDWQWDGPAEQSWSASLAGSRSPGEHVLTVELPAGERAPTNKVWLDGWGVTFRQTLSLAGSGVTWLAEADQALIPLSGAARLLDVSDPAAPLDLGVMSAAPIRTQPGHRYWLGVPWQAPEPARSRPLTTVDRAALAQAEYLMVAPEPFWAALEPLVQHRQGQGLCVVRLTPAQVYDAFGDGRPDPAAIRAMVQWLHGEGRLRYLLLVGDGSVRPGGYADAGEGALRLVTALVPTASLHETPSDQALVADDEGRALVAVGRLPAQTAAQVEAMVDKTIRWEEAGFQAVLLLTDDQPDFAWFADQISPWLPLAPQRLDAAQADARASTLAALQTPGVWLNYVGHGSLALWGDEKLLLREDRWPQPAVVTVWACLSGYFVHPQHDSLAEAWLGSRRGGAVAFVGPTGETYLTEQRPLAVAFYQAIEAGQSIGDALLAAWLAADESAQDAVRSFLLLGDPALQLSSPR